MATWRAFLSKGQCNSSNLDLNLKTPVFTSDQKLLEIALYI